jgi:hypothetical protein
MAILQQLRPSTKISVAHFLCAVSIRTMRNSLLTLSTVVLALGMVVVATHDARSETPLVERVENAIRSTKPGWRYTRGILNAPPPLVPSQRPLVVETWNHTSESGKRESVEVMIFQVDNHTDAKMSLSPAREGKVAAGWKVERFRIGDEGYLSTFKNGGRRFEIQFRRGTIVVAVSSDSFPLVDRFAQLVAAQIDTTPSAAIANLPQVDATDEIRRLHQQLPLGVPGRVVGEIAIYRQLSQHLSESSNLFLLLIG